MMKEKTRLDKLMVELGLAENPSKAQGMIRLGRVLVDGKEVNKPGAQIRRETRIEIKEGLKYVSRGGLKLESAIQAFQIQVADKVCLDVGASTGGFTDCLLQFGAKKVYSLDVGKGLIDQKLRNDTRVIVIEKFNARYLSPQIIPEPIQLATVDVSFISLTLVLPALKTVLAKDAEVLAMVKPQFELEPKLVKKGVVREPELQLQAVEKIANFAQSLGFNILGQTKAGLKGPKGNQEYFLWMKV